MLGSSRLTAYHIFAISLFNFLILQSLNSFPLSEREVIDLKRTIMKTNASTKKPK